jgi:hypothetical protein
MEYKRESRNQPKQVSTDVPYMCQEHTLGKRIDSSVMVLGKLDTHLHENETGPCSNTLSKIIATQRVKCMA